MILVQLRDTNGDVVYINATAIREMFSAPVLTPAGPGHGPPYRETPRIEIRFDEGHSVYVAGELEAVAETINRVESLK